MSDEGFEERQIKKQRVETIVLDSDDFNGSRSSGDVSDPVENAFDIPDILDSPFKLISSRDSPVNFGTVSLADVIGHRDLAKMWQFNFMIDIQFVLKHLADRHKTRCVFIKGARDANERHEWREAGRALNVITETVFIKYPYGTHHSKLMVLMFDDSSIQIVIHTSNMIEQDWRNKTQAVWMSERLPVGSGVDTHFKNDFINYLKSYNLSSATVLAKLLQGYNFTSTQAVTLIPSIPGDGGGTDRALNKLRVALSKLAPPASGSETVIQVSSIATLGKTEEAYLKPFHLALEGKSSGTPVSTLRIIFPTVDNVRQGYDGYDAGVSLHFRKQSEAQLQQLNYLEKYLCKWKADCSGRTRCLPHIKTYLNYEPRTKVINWVLMTSANLSKQAWGNITKKGVGAVQSYEIGVLCAGPFHHGFEGSKGAGAGLCIPYDFPLARYGKDDEIWSPHDNHLEKDSHGEQWIVQPF